jgi:hypothetical protein
LRNLLDYILLNVLYKTLKYCFHPSVLFTTLKYCLHPYVLYTTLKNCFHPNVLFATLKYCLHPYVLYTTLKYCLHPKCTLYDPEILFTSKCTLGQEKKYKKLHVFPLTCSIEILGSVGRKKILFLRIFLASFYRGHILTFNSACSKMAKKTLG